MLLRASSKVAIRHLRCALLLAACLSCGAAAQAGEAGSAAEPKPALLMLQFDPAETASPLGITRTILARHLDEAPKVDGHLEELWERASAMGDFFCAGGAERAPVETRAFVGHHKRVLYVAVRCRNAAAPAGEPSTGDRPDEAVAVLLNSRNDRKDILAIIAPRRGPATSYRRIGSQIDYGWTSGCRVASAENEDGWSAEIAIPRAAFDVPASDLIEFNVVRRCVGAKGEPFCWNPAPAEFEHGRWLGTLIFETFPCAIQKVEVGWPYVGPNRIRVWIRNDGDEERWMRIALQTAHAHGEDRSRYRVAVPARRTVQYALFHRIATAGTCDLEFLMLDEDKASPVVWFRREGLEVNRSPVRLETVKAEEKHVTMRLLILLPSQEAEGVDVSVSLRELKTFRSLASATRRGPPSRSATLRIDTSSLPPGDYQVHAYLSREGEIIGRVLENFTVH